ncbi:MAG: hypothetical protein P8X83_04280 [Nitrosopumilaceae archaeon]
MVNEMVGAGSQYAIIAVDEDMREEYISRARALVEGKLGLRLPEPEAMAA